MEVNKALTTRKAIRKFTDQQVTRTDIETLVQLAQTTPTWVNSQSQRVYVAMGDTLSSIRTAQHDLVTSNAPLNSDLPMGHRSDWSTIAQQNMQDWNAGLVKTLGSDFRAKIDQEAANLYNSQAVVYLALTKGYSPWALYDLGAFGQSLMLAAQERGIDTMPAYQFIKYPQMLRKHLSVTPDEDLILGIGLGYRDTEAPVNQITAERMPLDTILTIQD